ncbi:hypothetical protein DVR12_03105 [Chitinophaga silvatica]|uniref:Uncharacterized protein n=1 Tax=Chitinophaga silvatica TaxID=2282649 RepID=A0A3E1YHC6_9BACT|nr:hypothetical protein [Chitinophaga silvatica]RFS26789.1 hypothetical protein DVR12_03105 [Chitinophaga silvatica]
MEKIKKLFLLLELFLQQPEDKRQRKSWEMFNSLFIIFPPETVEGMINNMTAYSQEREEISEEEKLQLLVFSKYLNVTLKMLHKEVEKASSTKPFSGNLFSE